VIIAWKGTPVHPLRLASLAVHPLHLAAIVGVVGLVVVALLLAIWWRRTRK
jgi:hypothetical protein